MSRFKSVSGMTEGKGGSGGEWMRGGDVRSSAELEGVGGGGESES